MTEPERIIATIAEFADRFGAQAGVGASETAGLVVSILAQHPDLIPGFLADPMGTVIDWRGPDGTRGFAPENGCLSFHSQDGKVRTPQQLRTMLAFRDALRPSRPGSDACS